MIAREDGRTRPMLAALSGVSTHVQMALWLFYISICDGHTVWIHVLNHCHKKVKNRCPLSIL